MFYNGWVYEKVCVDELSNSPLPLIANFLIHLVITSTVKLVETLIETQIKFFKYERIQIKIIGLHLKKL